MTEFLENTYWGNTGETYLWIAGILFAAIFFKRPLSLLFARLLYLLIKRTSFKIAYEELKELVRKPFAFLLLILGITLAARLFHIPEEWDVTGSRQEMILKIAEKIFYTSLVISFSWILFRTIDFFALVFRQRATRTVSSLDDMLVPFGAQVTKVFVVIFALLFCLGSVFHLNIASLLAGVGIGGLALAFAAQESISNFFGSLTILVDHPFKVGDTIQIGNVTGMVEEIGIRSTRIRTLDKTLVTIPNKQLIGNEINNITLRPMHRCRFMFGLTYDTPSEKIKTIVAEIKKYLDAHPEIGNDSIVHFTEFGASSLSILVLYFVHTSVAAKFSEIQEQVNLEIMRIVKNSGAKFAFPTQTIYLNKEDGSVESKKSK